MEEKRNVTVFKSQEKIEVAIESGKSKQVSIVDLSAIDYLGLFEKFISLENRRTLFYRHYFPNLEELIYDNPNGVISRIFINSAIKRAKICCRHIAKNAFCQSSDLEYVDLSGTEEIALSAFDGTKISELTIPRSLEKLWVNSRIPENLTKLNLPVRYEKEIPVADTNLQIMGVRTANIETLLNNLGMKSYLELIAFNPEFYLRLPFDKNVTSKLLDKIMKIASKYFSRRLDDEDLTDKEHFNDYELLYLCRKKYKKEKAYISEASKKVEIVDEIIKTN